jgi:two-component system, cell cycle sensor histidine kinase and response regulator CckA
MDRQVINGAEDSANQGINPPDFRALFEAVPGLFLVLTPDFRIVAASDLYLRATMKTREEILGRDAFEVFPDNPADPTATGSRNVRESLARVLQNGVTDTMAVQKYDIRLPESEGGVFEERYWSPVNSPVFGPNGELTYIIHRVKDVTEFVRQASKREQQQENTNELRMRADQMEIEIYQRAQEIQDVNERLRTANTALQAEVSERKAAEERAEALADELRRFNQELESRVHQRTSEVAETNRVLSLEIAERQRGAEAQRQSEMRFRAMFNQTFEFVGVLDTDGAILDINRPALEFRDLTLAEVIGMPFWESAWFDISPLLREQAQQAVVAAAAGNLVRQEVVVNDKQGTKRTFDFSLKPVVNHAGQIELLIAEARDITEQKRLEEQFRQAQKMEAVGKLAGGIAHDFNNLLTIIMGYSDALQDSLRVGDPLCELVDQIYQAGERAAVLTRQLLAFSRKQVLVPVVLNLNTVVANMQSMLGRLIGEDIDLAYFPSAELWHVRIDPGQVEQVIMNLVVNARDAMPQGGKLTIETANVELDETYTATHPDARAGKHVVLAISDTGCGMDAATMAQIFEPFFSTKGESGTGLGLATVYGIVKQSGGHVGVHSEPGSGTSFKVFLPRDSDGTADTSPMNELQVNQNGTETILLVEDEDGVRSLARVTLLRHGYKVLEARNGGEALLLCEQHPDSIHLLATDVVMPNMSGRELAERLLIVRPSMKVLYMSGYMDDAIVRHGLVHANVPFLQKPYTPSVLASKVREVLDQ